MEGETPAHAVGEPQPVEAVLDVADAQREDAVGVLLVVRLALDPGQPLACDQLGVRRSFEPAVPPPRVNDESQGLVLLSNKKHTCVLDGLSGPLDQAPALEVQNEQPVGLLVPRQLLVPE
eukprot:8600857-Pyramimonas_sp.AAC.1